VLLNRDTAEGIANGTITLVLRRWDPKQLITLAVAITAERLVYAGK
jgi:hypothetical protein